MPHQSGSDELLRQLCNPLPIGVAQLDFAGGMGSESLAVTVVRRGEGVVDEKGSDESLIGMSA